MGTTLAGAEYKAMATRINQAAIGQQMDSDEDNAYCCFFKAC